MIYSLIVSLVLTLILELTMSLILGIRSNDDIKVVILVNTLTNPIVVFIANILSIYGNFYLYQVIVNIMEILVVFIEYRLYKKYLDDYKKSPFVLSLLNNVFSYGMGLIINLFF